MKKIFMVLLVLSSCSVYAVNNNDLLVRLPQNDNPDIPVYNGADSDQTGDYAPCQEIESAIYNKTYVEMFFAKNVMSIQSCTSGNTYYRNKHGFANFFTNADNQKQDTFDISGDKYQLQYFTDIESVNATLAIIKLAKKTAVYNSCIVFNQKTLNEYSKSMSVFNKQKELFNQNYAVYNAQLIKYNKDKKSAQLILDGFNKTAYNLCMSGGLADDNGNPIAPLLCRGYSQMYVIMTMVPKWNYTHNNQLDSLNKSLPVAPIMPNPIIKPDIENCIVAESGI